MTGEVPFQSVSDGLVLFIRVTPRASHDGLDGCGVFAGHPPRIRLRVRALPDKGAANKAVIAVLAKWSGLPKSSFSLTGGATNRAKTIHVAGDPAALAVRFTALLMETAP